MDKKDAILAEALDKMSVIFADAAKKLAVESDPEDKPNFKLNKEPSPVKNETVIKAPAETEKPKGEAAEQKQPEYKLEDVRKILTEVKQKGFGPQIKAIINAHGASNLTKLDPEEYAAVVAETEALHA